MYCIPGNHTADKQYIYNKRLKTQKDGVLWQQQDRPTGEISGGKGGQTRTSGDSGGKNPPEVTVSQGLPRSYCKPSRDQVLVASQKDDKSTPGAEQVPKTDRVSAFIGAEHSRRGEGQPTGRIKREGNRLATVNLPLNSGVM